MESLRNVQTLLNLAISFLELCPKEMITPERKRLKDVVLGTVYNICMLVKQKCPLTGNYISFYPVEVYTVLMIQIYMHTK